MLRRYADLKLLEAAENARYMRAREFNQLVENLRADGVLTSYPLIHQDEVLSGNHRVMAAMKAGLVEGYCIEIIGDLSESRKRAIQLSHNAIAGEDDPNLLKMLYGKLDFVDKLYSGLTDDMFNLKTVDLSSLSGAAVKYQELNFTFLPEQATEFVDLVERLQTKKPKGPVHLARLDDFDHFFDTIVRTKGELDVHNSALAVLMVVRLANERLDQLEEQRAKEPAPA